MSEQHPDFRKHLGLGDKKDKKKKESKSGKKDKGANPATRPEAISIHSETPTLSLSEKQSRSVDALMSQYFRLKQEALALRSKNKTLDAIAVLSQAETYLNYAQTIQNTAENKLDLAALDEILEKYGQNLQETSPNTAESTEPNPSLTATVKEGKDKGKELSFDIIKELKHWSDFYQTTGIDWVTLPDTISLTPDQTKEMTRLMELGFDKMLIIPNNLVGQPNIKGDKLAKPAAHYDDLHKKMSEGYTGTWYSDNYKSDGGIGASKDKTTSLRIILTKDVQNLKDDELFKQTLGKSVDDLTNKDGLFATHQVHGLSESEYLIYQREYFNKTDKHLDEVGYTWLTESDRPLSGRVADVYWYPDSGQLRFNSNSRDSHYDDLGCRLAGSFEIQI